jgi:hypothetical protein
MWILAPGQNVFLFCWSLHDSNIFHLSRPSHWNCTSVEEALILLLRLNDMLQVCSFISAYPCVNAFCSPAATRHSREMRNSKSTCLCCSCMRAVLPTVTRRLTSHPVCQSTQQSLLTACACFWRQNFARARCKYLPIRSGYMVYE